MGEGEAMAAVASHAAGVVKPAVVPLPGDEGDLPEFAAPMISTRAARARHPVRTLWRASQDRPRGSRDCRGVLGGLVQRRGKSHIYFMIGDPQGIFGELQLFWSGSQRRQPLRGEQRLIIHQARRFGFLYLRPGLRINPVPEQHSAHKRASCK